MSKRRREFLSEFSGSILSGSILFDKLGDVSIFNSSKDIITPSLKGTRLGSKQPVDDEEHKIYDINSGFRVRIEWDLVEDTLLYHNFNIPSDALESTRRLSFRDPLRVFDDSLRRNIVSDLAISLETVLTTDAWKEVSKEAIMKKLLREDEREEFVCERSKGYLVCQEKKTEKSKTEKSKTESGFLNTRIHSSQVVKLSSGGEGDKPENLDIVPEIVNFAQSINYEEDFDRGFAEFAQYPSETLYFGVGDCEDTAILLASFLNSLQTVNIRTALAFPPGHCATLAAIPDLPESEKYTEYITIGDVPYTYFETTKSTDAYETPEAFENVKPAFVYHNGMIKNINPKSFPSTTRRSLQLLKQTFNGF